MTKNLGQFKIDGKNFEAYPDKKLICWMDNGTQYVVEPSGKGYLARFVDGYTSKTIERITWHKLQYCALAFCLDHWENNRPVCVWDEKTRGMVIAAIDAQEAQE